MFLEATVCDIGEVGLARLWFKSPLRMFPSCAKIHLQCENCTRESKGVSISSALLQPAMILDLNSCHGCCEDRAPSILNRQQHYRNPTSFCEEQIVSVVSLSAAISPAELQREVLRTALLDKQGEHEAFNMARWSCLGRSHSTGPTAALRGLRSEKKLGIGRDRNMIQERKKEMKLPHFCNCSWGSGRESRETLTGGDGGGPGEWTKSTMSQAERGPVNLPSFAAKYEVYPWPLATIRSLSFPFLSDAFGMGNGFVLSQAFCCKTSWVTNGDDNHFWI